MIQELTIGGKSRPVRLGIAALSQFEEITGVSFLKGAQFADLTLQQTAELLRAGLISGARQNNQPIDEIPNVDGILDWMEDEGVLMQFAKVMGSQLESLVTKMIPEESRKNAKGSAKKS